MSEYPLLSDEVLTDLIERILIKGVEKGDLEAACNIVEAVANLDLPEFITAEDAASLEEFMEF